MLRVAVGLVAVVLAGGCSSAVTKPRCPDATREVIEGARHEPSTDFAWLRAYRHYYSIASVGPFAHHFVVGYLFVESSSADYDVLPDGTVVRSSGGGRGPGRGERRGGPIPPEQAERALAVERFHDRTQSGKASLISYLGSYRLLTVIEMMPNAPSGPPFARKVLSHSLGLRADERLTRIEGWASEFNSSSSDPCMWQYGVTGCKGPHWIDFSSRVNSSFPSLFDLLSGLPEGDAPTFERRVLSSARDLVSCRPGARLEALLARDSDSLLPTGFSGIVEVSFGVGTRAFLESPVERVNRDLSVRLLASEILRGTAEGVRRTRLGGVEFTAVATAKVIGSVPTTGRADVPMELRYRVSDDRGSVREDAVVLPAQFLVDGARAALQTADIPRELEPRWDEPPFTQRFPGTDAYDDFTVRFQGIHAANSR